MEKNLLVDMGISLPEGTNWDEVAQEITEAIIAIAEKRDGTCGGGVQFQEFDYEAIVTLSQPNGKEYPFWGKPITYLNPTDNCCTIID